MGVQNSMQQHMQSNQSFSSLNNNQSQGAAANNHGNSMANYLVEKMQEKNYKIKPAQPNHEGPNSMA